MSELCDIQALVNLFNPRNCDNSDSDHDYEEDDEKLVQQSDEKPKSHKANPYAKLKEQPIKNEDEVCEEDQSLEPQMQPSTDWKKTPKWDISYRQKVTASDVFLNMGAKGPSTASCEDMIVTIHLPGESMQNMDIKVFAKTLEVFSPNFNLKIPLPHPVHPQKGDAKWNADHEQLVITLRMEREFDFVNF